MRYISYPCSGASHRHVLCVPPQPCAWWGEILLHVRRESASDGVSGCLTLLSKSRPHSEACSLRTGMGRLLRRFHCQVGVHYDPMIAKLITKGPDRQTALDNLHTALSQLQVSSCPCCCTVEPVEIQSAAPTRRLTYLANGDNIQSGVSKGPHRDQFIQKFLFERPRYCGTGERAADQREVPEAPGRAPLIPSGRAGHQLHSKAPGLAHRGGAAPSQGGGHGCNCPTPPHSPGEQFVPHLPCVFLSTMHCVRCWMLNVYLHD